MRALSIGLGLLLAGLALSGCTYRTNGPVLGHYNSFDATPPRENSVTVCSAYGCKRQTKVTFKSDDLDALRDLMRSKRRADTPAEERRAVAYAIGWMERRVGAVVGTDKDRPGMEFNGSGDPTQQDCVDEATNTTSYLIYLKNKGLIRHHTVDIPFSKGNIFRGVKYWPHWTAVLKDTKSGQKWAVDSWIYKNGENPAVVEVENWYIKDLDSLPQPTT